MFQRRFPYAAVWLSHSSISDLTKCPRLYYLHNVYKEPGNRKIQVVSPYLTLGSVVHGTIERIRGLPREERFLWPLSHIFEELWEKSSGKKGGFVSADQEKEFKDRGANMIKRLEAHPGPLANLAIRINQPGEKVPGIWLSQEENLVLCGNVDWIEVLPDGSLHILDFKTGKNEEEATSLQLQIYLMLVGERSKRPISRTSYWYLDKDDEPVEIPLPKLESVAELLIKFGREMKQIRSQPEVICPKGGCRYCLEYDAILNKQAEYVGYDQEMNKNLYFKGIR